MTYAFSIFIVCLMLQFEHEKALRQLFSVSVFLNSLKCLHCSLEFSSRNKGHNIPQIMLPAQGISKTRGRGLADLVSRLHPKLRTSSIL